MLTINATKWGEDLCKNRLIGGGRSLLIGRARDQITNSEGSVNQKPAMYQVAIDLL